MPAAEIIFGESFPAQRLGAVKGRLLKIARRQSAESIENRQIGNRADLAILVGERTQTARAQSVSDAVDARKDRPPWWHDRRTARWP